MVQLSRREKLEAIVFYATTSLATLGWWLLLMVRPDLRPSFFGAEFGAKWAWLFVAPDVISAFVMSTTMVIVVKRADALAIALAWLHFGSQGYAWALAVGLAFYDPAAYWGVVGMTISSGIALAFAIRIQGMNILWGAFRFTFDKPRTPKQYWLLSLQQTFWMWVIFLAIIPSGIAAVEHQLMWNLHWIDAMWRYPVAALGFVLGGSLGVWAGRAMSLNGQGTPLPSKGTRSLVIKGPYRLVRNPMAVGGILQGVMVGLAWGSPLIMVYGLIGVVGSHGAAAGRNASRIHIRGRVSGLSRFGTVLVDAYSVSLRSVCRGCKGLN